MKIYSSDSGFEGLGSPRRIIDWQKELKREGNRVFLSGLPITMHCHHYNINLQKTLEETLGDDGVALLYHAAEAAGFTGFKAILARYEALKTVKSKLELAATIFRNSGLGIIHFPSRVTPEHRIISPSSHHVTGWLAKHGLRRTPGCHFSRGWIAGVLAAIHNLGPGRLQVEELSCKMMRDEVCAFQVKGLPRGD